MSAPQESEYSPSLPGVPVDPSPGEGWRRRAPEEIMVRGDIFRHSDGFAVVDGLDGVDTLATECWTKTPAPSLAAGEWGETFMRLGGDLARAEKQYRECLPAQIDRAREIMREAGDRWRDHIDSQAKAATAPCLKCKDSAEHLEKCLAEAAAPSLKETAILPRGEAEDDAELVTELTGTVIDTYVHGFDKADDIDKTENAILSRLATLRQEVETMKIAIEEESNQGPEWTCVGCGNTEPGKYRTITSGSPLDPPEYDIECDLCGSTQFEESPKIALHRVIDDRDSLYGSLSKFEAEIESLKGEREAMRKELDATRSALEGFWNKGWTREALNAAKLVLFPENDALAHPVSAPEVPNAE